MEWELSCGTSAAYRVANETTVPARLTSGICAACGFLRRLSKSVLLFAKVLLPSKGQESTVAKAINGFEEYLNMAVSQTAKDFRPLTQRERAHVYSEEHSESVELRQGCRIRRP